MEMPLLGIGTWKMGGTFERDMRNSRAEIASVKHALSVGYRLVDTAEMYGAGGAEEIVGEAIQGEPREDIYLVSKVWKTHLRAGDVQKACVESMTRLKTTYLDLYLIHWPDPSVPITETLSAMRELIEEKKIHAIGVSNFDVPALKEALAAHVPIYANQIEYSIVDRSAEKDIIPFCMQNNVRVMAYRPLGRGNLERAPNELLSIAKKRGATPAQIALSFITSQHITAIPKASSEQHIKENWESQNFPLSAEEIDILKKS